jgi:hypothetical protein
VLSEAFAVTVIVFLTVALFAGDVSETVGAVVSATVLFTVTVTLPLVVEFPAASFAIARKVCVPLLDVVVFQDML